MSDKKIIAVVGATGAQGGGLARAILDDHDGRFRVPRDHARTRRQGPGQARAARGARSSRPTSTTSRA